LCLFNDRTNDDAGGSKSGIENEKILGLPHLGRTEASQLSPKVTEIPTSTSVEALLAGTPAKLKNTFESSSILVPVPQLVSNIKSQLEARTQEKVHDRLSVGRSRTPRDEVHEGASDTFKTMRDKVKESTLNLSESLKKLVKDVTVERPRSRDQVNDSVVQLAKTHQKEELEDVTVKHSDSNSDLPFEKDLTTVPVVFSSDKVETTIVSSTDDAVTTDAVTSDIVTSTMGSSTTDESLSTLTSTMGTSTTTDESLSTLTSSMEPSTIDSIGTADHSKSASDEAKKSG
jgi:hypothetical protein